MRACPKCGTVQKVTEARQNASSEHYKLWDAATLHTRAMIPDVREDQMALARIRKCMTCGLEQITMEIVVCADYAGSPEVVSVATVREILTRLVDLSPPSDLKENCMAILAYRKATLPPDDPRHSAVPVALARITAHMLKTNPVCIKAHWSGEKSFPAHLMTRATRLIANHAPEST